MLLQGNLQRVFDALYNLGVIDPVLQMDWAREMEQIGSHYRELQEAVSIANHSQLPIADLQKELSRFQPKILNYLAMEVAREFADFHARDQVH
jgi:hypothetical protein